ARGRSRLSSSFFLVRLIRPPARSPLFPYTTLFRSCTRRPTGRACARRASDLDAWRRRTYIHVYKGRRHGVPDQARDRQEPAGVPIEGTPSDGGGARRRRALAKSQPRSRTDEARDHQVAGRFRLRTRAEERRMISGVWLPI